MSGMNNKVSNILGVAIPVELRKQFSIRSRKKSTDSRSTDDITYIANNTCWIRLVSSVLVKNESFISYIKPFFPEIDIKTPDALAKKFVLFAGSSEYKNKDNSFQYQLRSGVGKNGAYGTLGNAETSLYGYKPMSGIISAKIKTLGKLGSLKHAQVNFKVNSKVQLDIAEALYFKLGFSMFLEWGHTTYYNNDDIPKLVSNDFNQIDIFKPGITKEKLLREISTKIEKSNGNYGAIFGKCENFSYSMLEDGSYDCMVSIVGLGDLADELKINHTSALPGILSDEIKVLVNIYSQILRERQRQAQVNSPSQNPTVTGPVKAIIIGDSQTPLIKGKSRNLQDIGPEGKLWKVGWFLRDLLSAVKVQPKDETVNMVFINIGTNGSFNKNDDINGLISNIKLVFPNAILYAIKGSRGWGGVSNITDDQINSYYSLFSSKGVTILQNGIGYSREHPSATTPSLVPIGQEIDSIINSAKPVDSNRPISVTTPTSQPTQPPKQPHPNDIYNLSWLEFTQFLQGQTNSSIIPEYIKKASNTIRFESTSFTTDEESIVQAIRTLKTSNDFLLLTAVFRKTRDGKNDGKNVQNYINEAFGYDDLSYIKRIAQHLNSIGVTSNYQEYEDDGQKYLENSFHTALPNWKSTDEVQKPAPPTTTEPPPLPVPTVESVQKDESLKYRSGLEVFLRTIQLHSFNEAYTKLGVKEGKIGTINYTKSYIKQLFSRGVLADAAPDYMDNVQKYKDITDNLTDRQLLERYASYGFNHNLMSRPFNDPTATQGIPQVNFKELYKSYVVPYSINQSIAKDIDISYPVYIKLGYLIMILNHMCLLYDSPEGQKIDQKDQTPIMYIDFNTETNFCLSEPLQMSTDVSKFIIPFRGTNAEYKTLFDPSLISGDNIIPVSGSRESTPLFKPETQDFLSGQLPNFKGLNLSVDAYRGRIMDLSVNIDYILSLCQNFSNGDAKQSVKLRPFLQQIIDDINKYLGGINLLRLAYDDNSNCLYIVDDQIQPLAEGENQHYLTAKENRLSSVMPLFGKNSIARTLQLKTDLSSKLSNIVAISSNSNIKSDASQDATSFGYFSDLYKDRYIPQKLTIGANDSKKSKKPEPSPTDIQAAAQFNQFVINSLNKGTLSVSDIPMATNYYIERMNKRKGENLGTRSSALIPVSIEFSTDGISGLAMGNAFLAPDELLPTSYKTVQEETNNLMGFIITGLEETIENNTWTTDIKSNMIYLKNPNDFVSDQNTYNIKELKSGNFVILPPEDTSHYQYPPGVNLNNQGAGPTNYPTTPSQYANVVFSNIGYGNPAGDSINPSLLAEVSRAAVSAGVTVSITTAVSGHHTSPPSRHTPGNAVDIALIDKIAVRPNAANRDKIDLFVQELTRLGYVRNAESGNERAVLTFGFPDHNDHVHVSKRTS
jgi:hypothetical protein